MSVAVGSSQGGMVGWTLGQARLVAAEHHLSTK